ncbi:hypothetical protein F4779DRAFT_620982 [Xylariaceae sp. FL0662B]|nr:hypothetical protein F4779DRAFT_620982 [Xylariaceae sp. FL0662B]
MHPNYNILLAATLALTSTAHVILESPKPFVFVADGHYNPISSSGSDFPCKIPPGAKYQVDGSRTVMAIGEDQTASFAGFAVHGGGSCQFSLSPDAEPTKDSKWMVIHSIEGGCPARNQKGNLEGPNVDKYTFQIPEGIAPGDYTFSWTWQARIGGQPEYYQNCAPITVTAGKKKKRNKRMNAIDRRASLAKRVDFPELFMANMGDVSGGCTTSEAQQQQIAIAYPNPGASVERPEGDNLFKQPCDGNPRANQAQVPNNDVLPPTNSATSAAGAPGTTIAASSMTSASAVVTTSIRSSSATSTATSAPAAAPSAGTSDGAACIEGHLTCLDDGVHFATCTGGQLTPPQPIAPGFKCQPGSGVGLDISPASGSYY